jgi:hypothetical protein
MIQNRTNIAYSLGKYSLNYIRKVNSDMIADQIIITKSCAKVNVYTIFPHIPSQTNS